MRLITHTNIIVDDFEMSKDYPTNTFIHFLSHFHQDHWQGLTPLWDRGQIFCTEITSRYILHMFPKIQNIIVLNFNQTYLLDLKTHQCVDTEGQYVIKVTCFNAHHIPGSAMFLFQGFMGTIFHTGDFRFCPKMIIENEYLYPKNEIMVKYNIKEEEYECFVEQNSYKLCNISIPIDELIYDNTYCNAMFDFPTADIVVQQMITIINKNKGKRILIAMGALGQIYIIKSYFFNSKEDICLKLSQYYQTPIIVPPRKYEQMKASQVVDMNSFTTHPNKGWIEIVKKSRRQERIEKEIQDGKQDFICIQTDFLMLEHRDPDGINYMVPYSLHSNFREMETFVKSIGPCIIKKLVIPFESFAEYRRKVRINPLKRFQSYLKKLEQGGESGYSFFIKNYTQFHLLSQQYLQWMHQSKTCRFYLLFNSLGWILNELGISLQPDRENRKRKADRKQPIPSLKKGIRLNNINVILFIVSFWPLTRAEKIESLRYCNQLEKHPQQLEYKQVSQTKYSRACYLGRKERYHGRNYD